MKRYRVIYEYEFIDDEFEIIPNWKNGIIDVITINKVIAEEMVLLLLQRASNKIRFKIKNVINFPEEDLQN